MKTKSLKRDEALKRQEEYNKLTVDQKIKKLGDRIAAKQRARLAKQSEVK